MIRRFTDSGSLYVQFGCFMVCVRTPWRRPIGLCISESLLSACDLVCYIKLHDSRNGVARIWCEGTQSYPKALKLSVAWVKNGERVSPLNRLLSQG